MSNNVAKFDQKMSVYEGIFAFQMPGRGLRVSKSNLGCSPELKKAGKSQKLTFGRMTNFTFE